MKTETETFYIRGRGRGWVESIPLDAPASTMLAGEMSDTELLGVEQGEIKRVLGTVYVTRDENDTLKFFRLN
jgi:hypothetical protein